MGIYNFGEEHIEVSGSTFYAIEDDVGYTRNICTTPLSVRRSTYRSEAVGSDPIATAEIRLCRALGLRVYSAHSVK